MTYQVACAINGDKKWRVIALDAEKGSLAYECCKSGHDSIKEALQCVYFAEHQRTPSNKALNCKGSQLIEFIGVSKLLHFNQRSGLFEWNKDSAEKIERWMMENL